MKPVFVADSCVGGLSVVKSMWNSGTAGDAVFLADYAINPLGTRSDSAIADVVLRWLKLAQEHADTLVIACNTLSIRYHQLLRSDMPPSDLNQIVSMVDCFEAMVSIEANRLKNSKILVVGTEFTANQTLYSDILNAALPGIRVDTIAATDLEQNIARFRDWHGEGRSMLASDLTKALDNTDFAVLACTCFPMVKDELESLFPELVLIDPGAYCSELLKENSISQDKKLRVKVTGDVVSKERVTEFAKSYLGHEAVVS
jgi:glutamate racemase